MIQYQTLQSRFAADMLWSCEKVIDAEDENVKDDDDDAGDCVDIADITTNHLTSLQSLTITAQVSRTHITVQTAAINYKEHLQCSRML